MFLGTIDTNSTADTELMFHRNQCERALDAELIKLGPDPVVYAGTKRFKALRIDGTSAGMIN